MTIINYFQNKKSEFFFLLVLAGVQFTHILDFMIIMPLGPQLIKDLDINTHEFGLLISSYTFAAAISGLCATYFIDRFERRKLLLILYSGFIISTLACGFASNYKMLFLSRAVAGIFGGILGSFVQTIVADVIPYERRGKAIGTVLSAFSLATVAGVPLGLFLSHAITALDWRAPFIFIACFSVFIFFLCLTFIPKITAHLEYKNNEKNRIYQIFKLIINPEYLKGFLFISLIMLAGFFVIPYIALYLTTNVGYLSSKIFLVYLCGGIATLISSRFVGYLADLFGKHKIFKYLAILSLFPIIVTTHLVPISEWIILLDTTLFFVLVSGRIVPAMAILSQLVESKNRGTFMSLVGSAQMFSTGVASLFAGLIITKNAEGLILRYDYVGYFAAVFGLISFFLVDYMHPKYDEKSV